MTYIQRRNIGKDLRVGGLTGRKPTYRSSRKTRDPEPTKPTSLPADLIQAAKTLGITPARQSTDTTQPARATRAAATPETMNTAAARDTATTSETTVTTCETVRDTIPGTVRATDMSPTTTARTTEDIPIIPSTVTTEVESTPPKVIHTTVATNSLLYRLALAGREPAESLSTELRERLVRALWARGLTDTEIATHTKSTTYTVARIRTRLGLQRRAA